MIEPLFKGATRTPTHFGIPVKPFMCCFLFVGILSMLISVWLWLLLIPFYGLLKIIFIKDDKAFAELSAIAKFWHNTSGNSKGLY